MKRLGLLLLLAVVATAGIALVSSTPTEATASPAAMYDQGKELELMIKGFTTTGTTCYTCIQFGGTPCTKPGEKCDGITIPDQCWCRWCVDHFVCQPHS